MDATDTARGRLDLLTEILEHKRKELAARRRECPLRELKRRARAAPPARPFARALCERIARGRPAVIAECKKASPSRGVIRAQYDPAELARAYARAGAACLSVLTEAVYFQGSAEHLRRARSACDLPVLRKDFILDPYQVYEARAWGADCVLLIVAALTDCRLLECAEVACALGMDVLVEVHDREELERALLLRTPLLGINNRDLRSFRTDLETTLGLLVDIPSDRTVVTESGIHTAEHVALMRRHGVHAFLVGEALLSAPDPGAKLKELFAP